MASEVKFRVLLPGDIFIRKALDEDLITRYMKSEPICYESDFVYYDTPDWDLSQNGYMLRVCANGAGNAATLRCGRIEQRDPQGLYTGRSWLAYFESPDTIVDEFIRRGAYRQFATYANQGELAVRYTSHRQRHRTNLYLPERTRIDFALDSGEVVVDGHSAPMRHMSFTLSFGEVGMFANYCQQIIEQFSLTPDLSTMTQKALRLLRSR